MIEFRELNPEEWKGFELSFTYKTDGYYSFMVQQWNFRLNFHPFEKCIQKNFKDMLFRDWLEKPAAYGAFFQQKLVGVVEYTLETWNNRLRITNLLVWEEFRQQGIGSLLMKKVLDEAVKNKVRMAVLETQTCNRGAIDFYIKAGFRPIGFDLFAYANDDPENQEVRLEMGKKLV